MTKSKHTLQYIVSINSN